MALHRSGPLTLSAMIAGSSGIDVRRYERPDEAMRIIDEAFSAFGRRARA
jgi:hypothetical protein